MSFLLPEEFLSVFFRFMLGSIPANSSYSSGLAIELASRLQSLQVEDGMISINDEMKKVIFLILSESVIVSTGSSNSDAIKAYSMMFKAQTEADQKEKAVQEAQIVPDFPNIEETTKIIQIEEEIEIDIVDKEPRNKKMNRSISK